MTSFALPSRGARFAVGGLLASALLLGACDGDAGGDADPSPAPAVTETPKAMGTAEGTETPEATETAESTETPAGSSTEEPGESSDVTVSVSEEGDLAPYLVGPDGRTLYIFTNDEPGVSNCDASCQENWPPVTVGEGEEPTAGEEVPGNLGTIELEDGALQITYNEQPLYYYVDDEAPGDTNGHEVGDVWFVAEPEE